MAYSLLASDVMYLRFYLSLEQRIGNIVCNDKLGLESAVDVVSVTGYHTILVNPTVRAEGEYRLFY